MLIPGKNLGYLWSLPAGKQVESGVFPLKPIVGGICDLLGGGWGIDVLIAVEEINIFFECHI